MDPTLITFAVLAFLAVVLAIEGLYNLWVSKRGAQAVRITQRLAALSGERAAESGIERDRQRERMVGFHEALNRFGAGARLNRYVRTSGMSVTVGELAVMSLGLALFGQLLPVLFGKPAVFGLVTALGLGALPWLRISRRRGKRVARFEHQFPEALDLMGRAMRAGHAFPTAVRMVADEMSLPLGQEFRLLSDELNYGVPASEALNRLADRIPLPDVGFFVVAVMIQRESGGNLAELLDKISAIVRERLKLLGEVRTMSAEGRLSAIILVSLPFAVALLVNFTSPGFMTVLWTDPIGQRLTGVSLFMMLLGVLWMRSVIRIRV